LVVYYAKIHNLVVENSMEKKAKTSLFSEGGFGVKKDLIFKKLGF